MKHIVLTSMPGAEVADKWNAFISDAPFATHYVTPNYFADPYVKGQRFAVLAVGDDGQIAAALTGTINDDKITSGMFSRPQMVFRRDVERGWAVASLMEGLREAANGRVGLIEVYSWESAPEFCDHEMQVRMSSGDSSVVMLDLSAGSEAIFSGFSQTRRNELRKAARQGLVEVKEIDNDRELTEMYAIHCEWNDRKGNATDTFEQMKAAVGDRNNRRVFIAKADGKVIAGSFYRFAPGGVVEYAANFSKLEFQRLRPNDLIAWHAIQWACRESFTHFSMGGAHLFLRRFGGEIIHTYRYRRDNSRFRLHDLRENARDLGVGAYRRLPESVRSGMRRIRAK